jgi:hypothetical protein
MLNVCFNCGEYRADKTIDPTGPYAICPECGYKHPFVRLPLLIVSGASGVGKSTVCRVLLGKLNQVVLLDSDILWRAAFDEPKNKYRDYFETWLRVCKNISQSGRPVALFGAGVGVPENVEPCVERRYFANLHYLALVCDDDALVERLRARPKWRRCSNPAYIEEHVQFNRWFKENAGETIPPIDLLDTTGFSTDETAERVVLWIRGKMLGGTFERSSFFP